MPPFNTHAALPWLLLTLATLGALVACQPEPPPPPVSVGQGGRSVKGTSPDRDTTQANTPNGDDARAQGQRADKTDGETPRGDSLKPQGDQPSATHKASNAGAPQAKLPTHSANRRDQLEDPSSTQLELLKAAKEALNSNQTTAALMALRTLQGDGPMSGTRVSGVIALTDLLMTEGQDAEALKIIEALYRDAPDIPEITFVLGDAYKANGRLAEATLAFQQALKQQPLLLRAHIEIGGLLQQQGQTEASGQAFLQYERAIYKYAKLLEDTQSNPTDRLKIAEAFGYLPDDRAVPALLEALDDPYPAVRLAVADALGEVGTPATTPQIEAFIKMYGDQDPSLKAALERALIKIKASPNQNADDRVSPTIER